MGYKISYKADTDYSFLVLVYLWITSGSPEANYISSYLGTGVRKKSPID